MYTSNRVCGNQRKPQALQERTNRPSLYYDHTAMNLPTPSSQTRNCLHISTPPFRSDEELRRLERYSTVEEELVTSLKHCTTGASPQELQIRALKQAMSILSSYAQHSQERVERLRTVLADRKVEPEVYEKLQRERWMEEKRQLAVNEETKVVLRYLKVLNESSHDDTYVPCVPDPPAPALTAEARRDANLLMFLASTQTQAPIRTHRPSSTSFEHTLRRRTMDRVTPMKLRSSFTSPALVGTIKGHSRTVSLDRAKLAWQPPTRSSNGLGPTASMSPPHDAAILSVVAEDPDCSVDGLSLSESTSLDTSSSHLPAFETLDSTPLTSAAMDTCHILKTLTPNPEEDQGGTATIFRTVSHHSSDILANLHISLPDYALELFSHFEQSHIAPLKPIFPPSNISQPSSPHSFVPSSRCAHITSSFLQVPPSTPTSSNSSGLRRKPSHRNLFSIPPPIASRDGVDGGLGSNSSGGRLFSKSHQPVELLGHPSTASLSFPATENVRKVKKRWSVLWRQ